MAMTEQEKLFKYGPVVAIVQSGSQPDKKYEVRHHSGTNTYSCQCKGWAIRKVCTHTRVTSGDTTIKIKAPTVGVVRPAPVPQRPDLHVVSVNLAESIVGKMSVKPAAQAIERTLRDMIAAFSVSVPTVVEAAIETTVDRGVRIITLDD
jgi:hypothetical protein